MNNIQVVIVILEREIMATTIVDDETNDYVNSLIEIIRMLESL